MVVNPSLSVGILSADPVLCKRLEAPELPESPEYNIPHISSESTMQLPFGFGSALSDFMCGDLCAADFLLLCVFNYRSNYASGRTWFTSLRDLSRLTSLSIRYKNFIDLTLRRRI